jgi:hypothetical protein
MINWLIHASRSSDINRNVNRADRQLVVASWSAGSLSWTWIGPS